MVSKSTPKGRSTPGLDAVLRNGGPMDKRPKRARTRQTQRQRWLHDQDQ